MVTCNSKDKIAYVFRQDCIFKGHKSSKIYHKSFAVKNIILFMYHLRRFMFLKN